jgi:hypothetical protein
VFSSLGQWQATAVVLSVIAAVTVLAALGKVDGDTIATGLLSIGALVLGAGANAHGVRQGSKATADPPPTE